MVPAFAWYSRLLRRKTEKDGYSGKGQYITIMLTQNGSAIIKNCLYYPFVSSFETFSVGH